MTSNYQKVILFFLFLFVVSPFLMRLAGFNFVLVVTDSMEPTIKKGSLVITAPLNLKPIKNDSIVLYEIEIGSYNYTILHRVYKTVKNDNETLYYTKGDNRPFFDAWTINRENIKGVYLFSIPYLGCLLFYITGIIIILIPVITLFLAYKTYKEIKKEETILKYRKARLQKEHILVAIRKKKAHSRR